MKRIFNIIDITLSITLIVIVSSVLLSWLVVPLKYTADERIKI